MDIQELKKQEARRARKEAEILLRHASTQLNKTAYEIDVLIEQFKMARIPLKRQAILNEAIKHLAANLMPNLGLAQLAHPSRPNTINPLTSLADKEVYPTALQ